MHIETTMSINTEKTYQMYSSSRGTPEAFTAFINPSADIDCVRWKLHSNCTRVKMLSSRNHLCEPSLIARQHTCEKVSIPNFEGSKSQPVSCVVVVDLQPKRRKRKSLFVLAIQRDFDIRFTWCIRSGWWHQNRGACWRNGRGGGRDQFRNSWSTGYFIWRYYGWWKMQSWGDGRHQNQTCFDHHIDSTSAVVGSIFSPSVKYYPRIGPL